eukprot:6186604-Pleurochrysis_carterae.AAC.2
MGISGHRREQQSATEAFSSRAHDSVLAAFHRGQILPINSHHAAVQHSELAANPGNSLFKED